VIVLFVDIRRIIDHHCFKLSFPNWYFKRFWLYVVYQIYKWCLVPFILPGIQNVVFFNPFYYLTFIFT